MLGDGLGPVALYSERPHMKSHMRRKVSRPQWSTRLATT